MTNGVTIITLKIVYHLFRWLMVFRYSIAEAFPISLHFSKVLHSHKYKVADYNEKGCNDE